MSGPLAAPGGSGPHRWGRRLIVAGLVGLLVGAAVWLAVRWAAAGTCTGAVPPPGASTCDDLVGSLSIRMAAALGVGTALLVLLAQALFATADRLEEQRRELAEESSGPPR